MRTTNGRRNRWHQLTLTAAFAAIFANSVSAQDAQDANDDEVIEEIVVTGQLRSLPGESVESVFGFDKSLLETPRSASTVSFEQIERFNIKDIDELVVLAPGTFTQSFFGVAGSLDVRGTPGETYFRGIRRLDNPGNFPTPIGAADRVDIVRGPASPITGPSKIGGFLNFSPKSGRADSGQYLDELEGSIGYTNGTWDKNVLTAEVGGPGSIAGRDFGFWLYGEIEDSGSFYDNSSTDNTLIQASFDMDLNENVRIQFGGMYHNFSGNQIAGWNRVTQELIDDGTYITGSPTSVDLNGDGFNSQQELNAAGGGAGVAPFVFGVSQDGNNPDTLADLLARVGIDPNTPGGAAQLDALALQNPGTTQLSRSQVLVAADDVLANEDYIFYFDIEYVSDSGWSLKNQAFYEQYDNINENAYGFSQFAESRVFEDKLILAKTFETDAVNTAFQLSPSIRITNFEHGDDFFNEHFNRRDLTGPSTALDRRLLATRTGEDFSTFDVGDYVNFGIAGLVDLNFNNIGLNFTGGIRWDTIDIESFTPGDILFPVTTDVDASGTVDGVSWTASLSWDIGALISNDNLSLRPYFTASEQSTLVAGQGAEINTGDLLDDAVFDTSELLEYGIKGSLLDDKLYFAVSIYEQERTDRSAQSIVTNQTNRTEGAEIELRWAVTDRLILTAGWSDIEVTNLTTEDAGGRFSFVGTDDFPNVDPATFAGGTLGAIIFTDGSQGARRAGIPENIFTFTGTFKVTDEIAANVSVIDVDSVASGLSGSVVLPAYTLVNLGINYQTEDWFFGFNVKNVGNERYFRSNFPNLFGSQIVLPELPRNYAATLQYKF